MMKYFGNSILSSDVSINDIRNSLTKSEYKYFSITDYQNFMQATLKIQDFPDLQIRKDNSYFTLYSVKPSFFIQFLVTDYRNIEVD